MEHPIYKDQFPEKGFHISVMMVNPKTDSIDDDKSKNTKLQIWLESGEVKENPDDCCENFTFITEHDPRLDCGGDTFEEAIVRLYQLVRKYYKCRKKKKN